MTDEVRQEVEEMVQRHPVEVQGQSIDWTDINDFIEAIDWSDI